MSQTTTSIAQASPNIAFIKYWGNRDHELRIPANGSISMTLGDLFTTTRVTLDPNLTEDKLIINDETASATARMRAQSLLEWIRVQANSDTHALVESENSFPMGTGIASSASAFAALTVAACNAYGLELDTLALSRIARRASGSAARSLFPGYVELHSAEMDEGAYAESLHTQDHWTLIDLIAVVDTAHKTVSSSEGHFFADTSPIQTARVADAPRRLEICRQALQNRDFDQLAYIVEQDSNLMHAVMLTSTPPLLYWQPGTLSVMHAINQWRAEGLEVCYTIDAGPNVHCICTPSSLNEVKSQLSRLDPIRKIFESTPGSGAKLL